MDIWLTPSGVVASQMYSVATDFVHITSRIIAGSPGLRTAYMATRQPGITPKYGLIWLHTRVKGILFLFYDRRESSETTPPGGLYP